MEVLAGQSETLERWAPFGESAKAVTGKEAVINIA
jgi:hypothetical protein